LAQLDLDSTLLSLFIVLVNLFNDGASPFTLTKDRLIT
jgi:hypothetical protein